MSPSFNLAFFHGSTSTTIYHVPLAALIHNSNLMDDLIMDDLIIGPGFVSSGLLTLLVSLFTSAMPSAILMSSCFYLHHLFFLIDFIKPSPGIIVFPHRLNK